ncbi:hypothetical protein FGO68_gene6514 [Halteria grandinella]|uniref:Uncharacterized protein n=1 Tax=Halteria grandinella TaxID=5974 RepID=A0A8J8NFY8_HALGN|nr:hypothetical protein FGO68_gene6514 [Halteria grandinella]
MIKWDEFKKNFSEWDFVIYDDNQIQHNLNKMFNVWNGQIGAQLCRMNKIKYEQKKVDQRYHYEHEENAHYILVIEDSTLINQNEWEDIQLATFQIMKKILKSEFSKLSLIQYNQEARVVIDCDFVNQPFQPLIRNAFLSANFEIAFDQVLTQLNNHVNQSFERFNLIYHQNYCHIPDKRNFIVSSKIDFSSFQLT